MPSSREPHPIIEAAAFSPATEVELDRGLRVKRWPFALLCVSLGLVSIALFTFNASAVRFDLMPDSAKLEITAGMPSYRLGERYLMLAGDYTVTASAEGYAPLSADIRIEQLAEQNIFLQLTQLPGTLVVSTEPASQAQVFLDQKPVGLTPIELTSVQAGRHHLTVHAERFLPFDTDIEIEGQNSRQHLVVNLKPAWAQVTITSQPTGASISLDGIALAKTPATLEVLQGPRELLVTQPGFKPWQTLLDVVAQQDLTLPMINLSSADGLLRVNSTPHSASVTIADAYRGQTPLSLSLAPEQAYRMRLSKPGYQTVEHTVSVNADKEAHLDIQLTPILGNIHLTISPQEASLSVDGQILAVTSRRLELTAVAHTIRVEMPGYQTQEFTVTPLPEQTQVFVIRLKTIAEAKLAAIPSTITNDLGQELKLILPGTFTMGADRREPGRRANEIEKQVALKRLFYLSSHEVTNAQYQQFDSQHESGMLGRALLSGGDRPVVNVSWDDAVAFCNWLSAKQGLASAYERRDDQWHPVIPMTTGYRLPTEAEWAWASRYAAGSTPSRFPWGDTMPPVEVLANYADESAANLVPNILIGYTDHFRGTAPVGSFAANPLGLYDLAGNVSEWIHDYYSQEAATSLLIDPTGPNEGEKHVIRGSNYTHGRLSELRWTFRDLGQAPRPDVGFRVARYVE